MKLGSLLTLVASGLLLFAQADEKKPARPEVGKPAPTFRLNDQSGTVHSIGDKSDEWTVLAFFPKAMTPG
jgi:peroxiredoxin Q/BCP